MSPNHGKGSAEQASERAHRALDLRMAGASYRQIGHELGISYQTAFRDVNDALAELDKLTKRRAERLRDLELRRLDKMTLALQIKARAGDEKAIRALVLIMDRRAKLTGIDAPTLVDVQGGVGVAVVEARQGLLEVLCRLADRLQGAPAQALLSQDVVKSLRNSHVLEGESLGNAKEFRP